MKSLLSILSAVTISNAPVIHADPEVFLSFDFENGEIEQGFEDWYYSDVGENPCQFYNGDLQSKLCRNDGFKLYPYYNGRNSDHMGWMQYGYIDASSEFSVNGSSLRIHLTGGMYKGADDEVLPDGKPIRSKSEYQSTEDLGEQSLLPGDISLYYKGPTSTAKIPELRNKNRLNLWVLMPKGSVDIEKYSTDYLTSPRKSFSFYPFINTSKGAHYYHHVANIALGGWTKIQFDASPTHKNSGGTNELHAFSEGGSEYSGNGKEYFSNIAAFNLRADFSKYLPADSVYYIDEVTTSFKPYENEETIKSLSVGFSPKSKIFDISIEDKYRCLDCEATYEVRYSFDPIDNSNFDSAFKTEVVTNFDRSKSNSDSLIHKPTNGYNLIWAALQLQSEHTDYIEPGTNIYFAVRDVTERAEGRYFEEDNITVDVPGVGILRKRDLVKSIDYQIMEVDYPLTIKTDEIQQPIVGYNYEQEISVEGGKGTYQLQALGLPDGLSIDGTKIIGVASQPKSDVITLTAMDEIGQSTDIQVQLDVVTEDQLLVSQCKTVVAFSDSYLPTVHYDSVFNDIYTGFYLSGMTTLLGSNSQYNYQGISGAGIQLDKGDKVRLTWKNIGDSPATFHPRVSFTEEGRYDPSKTDSWKTMPVTTVNSDEIAVTEHNVNETIYATLININSNFSNNKTLLLEKIELVSSQFNLSDTCRPPISLSKAETEAKLSSDILIADFTSLSPSIAQDSLHEAFSEIFMDTYTGFYESGLTILHGDNSNYNYQGVKGTGIEAPQDAVVKLTWKNYDSSKYLFTPTISFDFEGRRINGGTWFGMTETSIEPYEKTTMQPGEAYSYIAISDLGISWFDLVNINANVKNNKGIVLEKIELVSSANN